MIYAKKKDLIYRFDDEILKIEAWGENALRVRATKNKKFIEENWALRAKGNDRSKIEIIEDKESFGGAYANMYRGKNESYGLIKNGNIKAKVSSNGVVCFYDKNNKLILKEDWKRLSDSPSLALDIRSREYIPQNGENYEINVRFKENNNEKIFGMGQYQQEYFDMKGCNLELAQRNSQVTIPFYISNLGYGFLWNNPGLGKVMFGKNGTQWHLESSKQIDYLVIAEQSPIEIEKRYMEITGKPPMMPEYGMGFWQCKLRYKTQEELLEVARKYHELGIKIDVIIADFFHWTQQGEYKFNPKYWPNIEEMCNELEKYGIKLMVSIWPTVDYRSENFKEMMEKGYLVRVEQGIRVTMQMFGQQVYYDTTNKKAREYVWGKVKKNYWDKGAKLYWLDVAEPEYTKYNFRNYRYQKGSVLEVGNIYPKLYIKGFYDGMTSEGDEKPILLARSAWAGSAKYGALVWSGDIDSTFESFRRQIRAGLSMAVAGIPWWTTDIGGFHGANINDKKFKQLLIRWFEYSCFSPVFRLHGNREPMQQTNADYISGIGELGSGAVNEIWSYGKWEFDIMKKYIELREKLRNYIRMAMEKTHKYGIPIMRPLFFDFPNDKKAWEVDDSYMFGDDYLIAPIMYEDKYERKVYLPENETWIYVWNDKEYVGGREVLVDALLEQIPVFVKKESKEKVDFDI